MNMKKTNRLVMVLACVLMVVGTASVFAGGKKDAAAGGQVRVAVILKTLSSPYWQTVLGGAQKAGTELNVQIDAFGPPTEDGVEEQINMLESAINSKYDAIVFSPCQPPAAVNALNKAKAAGIPVIVIDTPMPSDFTNYVTYIGSDNVAIGKAGAEAMVKALPKNAKVFLIEGAPGNPSMTQRCDGASEVFKAAGFTIVDRQPAYSDRERAFTVMQNQLQKGDVDGVFAGNDDSAEGALRALQQNGKKALVMGVDGNKSAKESVRDGGLFGTVAQLADQMGYQGVKYGLDSARGNPPSAKVIDAGKLVITKENVAQNL
jgi:ribose transport system substrate-binding protein